MVSIAVNVWISFLAGLFAPLGAVCVLPLYPAFLSYLAAKLSKKESKRNIMLFGFMVIFGVLFSMMMIGFLFTFILQKSLTTIIGIVSPIAFSILAIVSILLIFNVNLGGLFPQVHAPVLKNPFVNSFVFGLFFGVIVLPCNPASLIVLFALSTSLLSFFANLLNFLFFGLGMAFPLLLLSLVSAVKGQRILIFLVKWKRVLNLIAGVIMLIISLYYLIFVFRILG